MFRHTELRRLIDRFRRRRRPVLRLLAYLGDLILLSISIDEHLHALCRIFSALKEFQPGLHGNPLPRSCRQHLRNPSRQTSRVLPADLQTCSWYRKFIPQFAKTAQPLSKLTSKKAQWEWGIDQDQAFNALREALTSAPILKQADHSQPYILRTDASAYALVATLLQGERIEERPVEYGSYLLTAPERNYPTTEQEALAIVRSVGRFRGYLEETSVIVDTDHQPLKWLMALRSPSGRLARWALQLQPYNLQIRYGPGKANVVADMLSRPPQPSDLEPPP